MPISDLLEEKKQAKNIFVDLDGIDFNLSNKNKEGTLRITNFPKDLVFKGYDVVVIGKTKKPSKPIDN